MIQTEHLLKAQGLKGEHGYIPTHVVLFFNPPVPHNGLYYKVIRWEAVVNHENAVRQLVAGDNLDAGFTLGQTDVYFCNKILIWTATFRTERFPKLSSDTGRG